MSGRASKKMRRLSTDSEGSEDGLDLIGLKPNQPSIETGGRNGTRGRTVSSNTTKATISREPPPTSSRTPGSLRLSVKAPASKLREVTTPLKSPSSVPLKSSRDPFFGGEIIEGKRARTVKQTTTYETDEEDEDEEMDDLGDEDAEGESVDEDEDAEGDVDMDMPTPPVIKATKAPSGKRTITFKPPPKVVAKTVEQKEVDDDSDEELSELDSNLGEDEAMQSDNDEDAEGEEIEEEEEEEEEAAEDSDEFNSRASTPDLSKLTKRQRARIEEGGSGYLLALPDEVQVKKHFTAEEQAMRRAEMLRRRKNLSEKRNEEEKMETINKLLKRQAPKTNARRKDLNSSSNESVPEPEAPKPDFIRWVSNKDGNRIMVPEEWIDAPVGAIFRTPESNGMGGKLIQEVS